MVKRPQHYILLDICTWKRLEDIARHLDMDRWGIE
jgi:hypothetical protein